MGVEEEEDVALGKSCSGQPCPDESVPTFQPQHLHLGRELPLDVARQLTLVGKCTFAKNPFSKITIG